MPSILSKTGFLMDRFSIDTSAKNVLTELPKLLALAGVVHTVSKVMVSYLKARRMHKMIEDVPHGKYAPGGVLGFLKDFMENRHRQNHWWDEVSKGMNVCKFIGLPYEPSHVWFCIRDPASVKHILKDKFDIYSKADIDSNVLLWCMRFWIGDGIFTVKHGVGAEDNGHLWFNQRKLAAGMFTKANFGGYMAETFVDRSQRMCRVLENTAKKVEFIDLQDVFFRFTMDSIMDILFGEKIDTLGGDDNSYGTAYDTAHWNCVAYVNENIGILSQLVYLPYPFGGYGGLAWSLNQYFSKTWRTFWTACKTLSNESDRLVAKCRADPKLAERRDLLARFVQSEEKQQFSNKYLRDATLNFVIAGRDTTACTLSWFFYVLTTYPEIQKTLQQEVDEKLADEEISLKSVCTANMPYLNGVLYEVLRYYPIVPVDPKQCHQDDTLPDGTRIPKGSLIFYMPYVMGRDPNLYEDPDTIRPERWIPFKAPQPHDFPTFQAGPRICLGQEMAIFEMKVAIVSLLKKFSFEIKEGEAEKIHYAQGLTMSICNSQKQESNNLWMRPSLR